MQAYFLDGAEDKRWMPAVPAKGQRLSNAGRQADKWFVSPYDMRIAVATICFVLAAGCADEPRIALTVTNTGTRTYDDVEVISEEADFSFNFDTRGPLQAFTHHDALVTIPHEFHVTYVDRGEPRQARLDVPPHDTPCVKCTVAIVFPTEGPPVIKIVIGNWFTSTVIPDSSNSEFRQYRALASATYERNHQEVTRLLEAGTPLFWDDPEIQSPLEWAAISGDLPILKSILANVDDVPLPRLARAFKHAAQDDHVDCLRELRTHVDSFTPEIIRDALAAAVEHGNGAALRYFVEEAGVPINTPVNNDHTLLDIAVIGRKDEMASYLRGKGGLQVTSNRAR